MRGLIIGGMLSCAVSGEAGAQVVRLPGPITVDSRDLLKRDDDGRLSITTVGISVATRALDLEKINCSLLSAQGMTWVVKCDRDDRPDHKDRVINLNGTHHDGSGCVLTVRYLQKEDKWDVDIRSVLAEPCRHSWLDDHTLEVRAR